MKKKLILIGASTGGPGHLEKILSSLEDNYPYIIIIAQHMNELFIPSLVKRFKEIVSTPVYIGQEHKVIKAPCIIFTQADITELTCNSSGDLMLYKHKEETPYLPSINTLFTSASTLASKFDILAILLTGIGDDGAKGLLTLKNTGAKTLAENEESAIVYGMPKVAREIDAAYSYLNLQDLIVEIKKF